MRFLHQKYLRIFPRFLDKYLLIGFPPYHLAFLALLNYSPYLKGLLCVSQVQIVLRLFYVCFILSIYIVLSKRNIFLLFLYLWVPMKRCLLIKILLSPALHLILVASFCHRIKRHMPRYSRETTVSPAPVKKPQSWSTESGQRTYPDAFCFSGPGSFPMTPLIHNNLVLQIL